MNALRNLQERCYRAFLLGETSPLLDDLADIEIPASISVQVYRNNACETYRKALAASFPVVEKLVGDDCFRGIASRYMRDHPSTSGDLQDFGAALPRLLGEIYGDTEYAYLADVARLEWAMEEVQLVAEDDPLDLVALSAIDPCRHTDLRFLPARSARLIQSRYPVLSIWRSNQPGAETDVRLDSGGQDLVIRRRGGDVELRLLSRVATELARRVSDGVTLAAAFAAVAGASEIAHESDPGAALQELAAAGYLGSFELT